MCMHAQNLFLPAPLRSTSPASLFVFLHTSAASPFVISTTPKSMSHTSPVVTPSLSAISLSRTL